MPRNLSISAQEPGIVQTLIQLPSVTIAIPTFNEAVNIERIVRNFLATSYPNLVEIHIADGGSTDTTPKIIQGLALEDDRVKLIHNPMKVQSAGLNLILANCSGEVFLRADAHSDYAPDYIERCVEALLESEALNAGGAQRFVAQTPFQAGIALATKSLLGSGGAKYRDPDYSGYADTVYLGCFWRKALLKIANFDTTQITNQDAELNQRLLQQNKTAIYISSKIRAWYYPRKSWKSLWEQYFKYGRGRCLTATKHAKRHQIRGQLPFMAISIVIGMGLASIFFPSLQSIVIILFGLGILAPIGESLRVTLKYDRNFTQEIWRGSPEEKPSLFSRLVLCYVTLMTIPIAHFSGYGYQLIRRNLLNVQSW
jgi:succinoglycan biosynthesis protein ExoA